MAQGFGNITVNFDRKALESIERLSERLGETVALLSGKEPQPVDLSAAYQAVYAANVRADIYRQALEDIQAHLAKREGLFVVGAGMDTLNKIVSDALSAGKET